MPKYPLNPAQKQAVEYASGPLLIVAGAGTGKTTVITQKITHLIENKLATPEQILALTFTEKAAGEMQTRVDEMLELGYVDMQISTFHAFCQRILENHGLDIGLPNQFKLLTETDAWLLVRRNLDKFDLDYYRPLGNPAKHIHELLKHFSKCKDELITPQEYLEYAEGMKLDSDSTLSSPPCLPAGRRKRGSAPEVADSRFHGNDSNAAVDFKRLSEIANAYHAYNQLLLDNSALDFGDLIFYTIKLLRERPNILKLLRERYKYILVDEFQDVNWAQYQLVQMIAGEENQLTVVGDDDQSIYAFRGASVNNILRFKEDYSQAKEIVLNENYRSCQEILDLAYKSIQNNNPDRLEVKLKINKRLTANCHPERSEGSFNVRSRRDSSTTPQNDNARTASVCHIHSTTLDEEVKSVVDEIARLRTINESATWDDFAILVRANAHADPFINALEKQGIPYEFIASAGLYRQPIVLDCINFLKLLDNHHESTAIFRLLNLSFLQFPAEDIQKITSFAKKKSVSYFESLRRASELYLSVAGFELAQKITSWIKTGQTKVGNSKPTTLLVEWLEESGYFSYLIKQEEAGNRGAIRQIHQLKQFLEYISAYETAEAGATVSGFLEHFNYIVDSGDKGSLHQMVDTPDSVNILTIHGSKGLEFKYVFVVNLVEERFPSRARSEAIEIPFELIKEQLPEGDEHIEEERRLFYVAMTRAKEKLYLTSADDYGGSRQKKNSRFLSELGYEAKGLRSKEKGVSEFVIPTEPAGRAEESLRLQSLKDSSTSLRSAQNDNDQVRSDSIYHLPERFSYSQLNSYSTCPYQYKLANVVGIPTKGNANFSFGQSMHGTLQAFYERARVLNSATQDSLFSSITILKKSGNLKIPEIKELLEIYDQHWIDDWYESKGQRDTYYTEGKEVLKKFYEENEKNGWTVPVTLEGSFRIKIGGFTVSGRIDRIDQLPDGSLHIVDYKTGKGKEKLSSDDKNQLLIYQLAVKTLPEYYHIGVVSKLTFYYLNQNSQISFFGSEKEIVAVQEKMLETIQRIHARDFAATPSQFICGRCDFRDICEFRA
ncbi:MAG: ATP-dependent DNA helicase [Candidatus Magasanikbacteria bacterium]